MSLKKLLVYGMTVLTIGSTSYPTKADTMDELLMKSGIMLNAKVSEVLDSSKVLKDHEGRRILTDWYALKYADNKGTKWLLEHLGDVRNNSGENQLYNNDIIRLQNYCIEDGECTDDDQYSLAINALKLAKISYKGNDLIIEHDITNLLTIGGNAEQIERFLKWKKTDSKITGSELVRYIHLGIDEGRIKEYLQTGKSPTFLDTEKPNMLLVYAASDWSGAFHIKEVRDLYNLVSMHFDVEVKVVEQEGEVYSALESTPDLRVWMLLGHGSTYSVSLRDEDPRIKGPTKDETFSLDTGDHEIRKHLENKYKDLVTVLVNCDAGAGTDRVLNFANFIGTYAPGKLYSAKGTLDLKNIEVTGINPFEIAFYKWTATDGFNMTYIVKSTKNFKYLQKDH